VDAAPRLTALGLDGTPQPCKPTGREAAGNAALHLTALGLDGTLDSWHTAGRGVSRRGRPGL